MLQKYSSWIFTGIREADNMWHLGVLCTPEMVAPGGQTEPHLPGYANYAAFSGVLGAIKRQWVRKLLGTHFTGNAAVETAWKWVTTVPVSSSCCRVQCPESEDAQVLTSSPSSEWVDNWSCWMISASSSVGPLPTRIPPKLCVPWHMQKRKSKVLFGF